MGGIRPTANGTVVAVNSSRVCFPEARRVPNRRLGTNSVVGICIINVMGPSGGPDIGISEARESFMEHLFRLRMPRVCSNAIRIGTVSERTNSEDGVTIVSAGPSISPVNAYVNGGEAEVSTVMGRLNNRGVSVVSCDRSSTRFVTGTLTPTRIVGIALTSSNAGDYIMMMPGGRLSLTVNGGNRGTGLTTHLANCGVTVIPLGGRRR